jgi:hypothetical protein
LPVFCTITAQRSPNGHKKVPGEDIHPSEILREDFLILLDMRVHGLAIALAVAF